MYQTIIITGASNGIGASLFTAFKEQGYSVYGTYNSSKAITGESNTFEKVDVSDFENVNAWITSIEDNLHNIVLINCAGISYNAFAHKSDLLKWKHVIDVNLTGTFNVIHRLLPLMRQQNFGRIINISSVVAQKGAIGTSAYAASKAGLWGLTKTLALENASRNILINNINLGYINTGLINQIPDIAKDKILNEIPLKHFGEVKDVFQTVCFLTESEYITGTSIDVNGGLY